MSLADRLAAARNPEHFNPYGNGSSVAADGMRLAEKRARLEQPEQDEPSEQLNDEPVSSETYPDDDPLFGEYVDTDETSTPTYDGMKESTVESNAETQPEESNLERSSSRLANLLRSSARGVETTAEKWDDTKSRARTRLGRIGRAALSFAVAGGELAEGVRTVATDKMLEFADRADDKLFNAVDSAKEGAKSAAINTALRAETAVKNGMGKVEAGMDTVGTKMIELSDGVKERLSARKSAAIARRTARRERWAGRVNAARETVRNTKDAVVDTTERARQKRDALRAIGRVAIDARAGR